MDLHVSIYEAKIERSPQDFFTVELSDVSANTTLTAIFDQCWKKQSTGVFNWNSFHVVATCRGQHLQDLSRSLAQLNLHSGGRLSLHFVARNRHWPAGNSQQLVEQTLHALHAAALMPGGLLALCKAAGQLDAADVPGLGEDRRALEIVTDYRLQSAMLRRPRLLQQLVRQHPALAAAIITLAKRVRETVQTTRLPAASPAGAATVAGNMPLGANYNVDFESVLDEDDENGEQADDAGAAAAAPVPTAQHPRSRPSSSGAAASAAGFSGTVGTAGAAAAGNSSSGAPGGGVVSSDFLRSAMAQAFTLIPARQRFAAQLRALRDMGITDEEAALRVLEQNNGDLELTIDNLFS